MIVKHLKAEPLDHDPFDDDCCGTHHAETLIIDEDREARYPDGNNVRITIKEFKSGLGDSFKIIVEGKGLRKEIFTEVDDNGEFYCTMSGNDLHFS